MVKFDLKFGTGENGLEFSPEYKTLIENSCKILVEVINSKVFEDKVLGYSWVHKRKGRINQFNHTFVDRAKILQMIRSGDDNFIDEYSNDNNERGDMDIDIWIIPYFGKRRVIGMTNPTTYKTWLNLAYWNDRIMINKINPFYTKLEIAENIIHEYCHNLGFNHKKNKKHKYNNIHSVPYAIGVIFYELALEKYKTELKINGNISNSIWLEDEHKVDCSFCN